MPHSSFMSSTLKFIKLQNLLKNFSKIEQYKSPIASTLGDNSLTNLDKNLSLDLSKDFLLYFSIIKKPLNLLFSMDQFIFEFSKKKYQQKKTGEFLQQLKERKKLSLFYGSLTRRQIVTLFKKARKFKGSFSATVFSLLERRLDLVLYRSGFTKTVVEARQLIKHKKIQVNDNLVSIPSFGVSPGDLISMLPKTREVLGCKLARTLKSPVKSSHSKIFEDFHLKLQKTLDSKKKWSRLDGSIKKKCHRTDVFDENPLNLKASKKVKSGFYQFPTWDYTHQDPLFEKSSGLKNLSNLSIALQPHSSFENLSTRSISPHLQEKNQEKNSKNQSKYNGEKPSKSLCKRLVRLLCTRIKLRCFITLKEKSGWKHSKNLADGSNFETTFFKPLKKDFDVSSQVLACDSKANKFGDMKANSKEKQFLVLVKRHSFSSKKKSPFSKHVVPFSKDVVPFSKHVVPFSKHVVPFIQKNFKKNQPIFLYANQGSSQKQPQITDRHTISTPFSKHVVPPFVSRNWNSHSGKQNEHFREQRAPKNMSTLNRKDLGLYREGFVFFLKCLENSTKFQNLVILNLKKSFFSNSLYKKKNFSSKNLIFIKVKPTHLEVSYSLLNVVYLFSPQRINFPFFIDLDLIHRSLR